MQASPFPQLPSLGLLFPAMPNNGAGTPAEIAWLASELADASQSKFDQSEEHE